MGHISLYDAKTHLSGLVERAAAGEEFVIAKNGVPMAKLVPLAKVTEPRKPARAMGIIRISPDFDEPDAQIEALFAGGEPDDGQDDRPVDAADR
ncbi:prevent-host-death family protein [Azospirillum brasilense]|uniref:Antitoxin n=1 Tax=Azospirillum brasilense TaxID=192 RepID=A0A560CDL9_AZOBR|nr:type II toxin-antitoxin system prevent-host-death family antitoxin [Azospirillum brasilense]TWA82932.1 prevent-host-death family protein [Azospirillum brasilense]